MDPNVDFVGNAVQALNEAETATTTAVTAENADPTAERFPRDPAQETSSPMNPDTRKNLLRVEAS